MSYRTGDHDNTRVRFPGLKKYANVVLKRGFTKYASLWKCRKQLGDGQTQHKSGWVTLHDESNLADAAVSFKEAWPSKLTGLGSNERNNGRSLSVRTCGHGHDCLATEGWRAADDARRALGHESKRTRGDARTRASVCESARR